MTPVNQVTQSIVGLMTMKAMTMMNSIFTCPVGRVRVLLAALDSLHGICQRGTSLSSIEQGSVEGMDKNFGGRNRYRPQGHKSTLGPSSEEGSGQSHHTVCCHLTVGLLV